MSVGKRAVAPAARLEQYGDDAVDAGLRALPEDDPELVVEPGVPSRLTIHLAISVGAVLGATARLSLSEWAAANWGTKFPWGTLAINVSGSALLGFYLALVLERFTGRYTVRLFLATGLLGAYTTFSTFTYEAIELLLNGNPAGAAAYVGSSLVFGLAGVAAGMLAAHAL